MQLRNILRLNYLIAFAGLSPISGCRSPSAAKLLFSSEKVPILATAEMSYDSSSETGPLRDIELTVELPQRAFSGAAIPVKVTLTNSGNDEVQFFVATPFPHSIELLGPDGSAAPFTDYGRNNLGDILATTVTTMQLSRGLSRVWEFDLHRLFEFSRPGVYTVNIAQAINYAGEAPDRSMTIQVRNLKFEVSRTEGE